MNEKLTDTHCDSVPEDVACAPFHCVHEDYAQGHEVCCWCGDLFEPLNGNVHGEYKPGSQ